MLKTPLMVRSEGSKAGNSAHSTNLIHLTRFAPPIRLGPNQVFKVRGRRGVLFGVQARLTALQALSLPSSHHSSLAPRRPSCPCSDGGDAQRSAAGPRAGHLQGLRRLENDAGHLRSACAGARAPHGREAAEEGAWFQEHCGPPRMAQGARPAGERRLCRGLPRALQPGPEGTVVRQAAERVPTRRCEERQGGQGRRSGVRSG